MNNEKIDNKYAINPEKWIAVHNKNKTSTKKYFFTSIFFIIGIVFITLIKNETRSIQQEIVNLKNSIRDIKIQLHEATLDHQILTSPEYISELASQNLDENFLVFERSQIEDIKLNIFKITKVIESNKKEEKNASLENIIADKNISSFKQNKSIGKADIYEEPFLTQKKVNQWVIVQIFKAIIGLPPLPVK